MDDKNRGLYGKFHVKRADGSSDAGGKHEHCKYFVLDLTHDPFAIPALSAYADACKSEYPALCIDLQIAISNHNKKLKLTCGKCLTQKYGTARDIHSKCECGGLFHDLGIGN